MNKNQTVELVETEEETSRSKGKELEEEFSKFMKKKLGWSTTRVGSHLAGRDNRKGTSVDIVGNRLNQLGMAFKKAFKVYALAFVVLIVIGMIYGYSKNFKDGVTSTIFYTGLIFEIAGVGALIFSNIYNRESALVECKNLKGKANINHISKTLRELEDYKKSGDKEHKFKHHYFVSTNGYVENALRYAQEHGITCYEKENGKFVQSQYWS